MVPLGLTSRSMSSPSCSCDFAKIEKQYSRAKATNIGSLAQVFVLGMRLNAVILEPSPSHVSHDCTLANDILAYQLTITRAPIIVTSVSSSIAELNRRDQTPCLTAWIRVNHQQVR